MKTFSDENTFVPGPVIQSNVKQQVMKISCLKQNANEKKLWKCISHLKHNAYRCTMNAALQHISTHLPFVSSFFTLNFTLFSHKQQSTTIWRMKTSVFYDVIVFLIVFLWFFFCCMVEIYRQINDKHEHFDSCHCVSSNNNNWFVYVVSWVWRTCRDAFMRSPQCL